MTSSFRQKLRERIRDKPCGALCVGIDPPLRDAPGFLQAESVRRSPRRFLELYGHAILEASAGLVGVVKFQAAYFEAFGSAGVAALERCIRKASDLDLIVILDAKRGDIGSTQEGYGQMAFDALKADALTVTPYMGLGVVLSLRRWLIRDRGAYVVLASSNPDAHTFQLPRRIVDALLGPMVDEDLRMGALGVVVGAQALGTSVDGPLENDLQHGFARLVPGLGAQGGEDSPRLRRFVAQGGDGIVALSRALASPGTSAEERSLFDRVQTWDAYQAWVHTRLQAYRYLPTGANG